MASPYTATFQVTAGAGEHVAVVGSDPDLPLDDATVGEEANPAIQLGVLHVGTAEVSATNPLPISLDSASIDALAWSSVVAAAWWTVPTGPDFTLSMRRGQRTVLGVNPPYDIVESCWGTFIDRGDRHGPFLFRPSTQDEANYLLSGPDPIDIAALGGIDIECSVRAVHPCLTTSTFAYLAQQSILDPPIKDWAVGINRQGRLFFEWQDSADAFHVLLFGPELGFMPPVDRFDVRVNVIDNGDGTATGWAWHKFDHDGPWLPLDPFIGEGSEFDSLLAPTGLEAGGLTAVDPDFTTRTDPACTGYARGFHYGMTVREPSADPVDTPGAEVLTLDMTDGVGSLPGDTFTSGGYLWTLGADSVGVILDPEEDGWLYRESSPFLCNATIPAADVPISFAGDFSIGVRFTPTLAGALAQYLRTVDLGAPPQPAGLIIGDLSAYALDHVVVLADGTVTITDDGIVLTYMDPHDLVIVVDRTAELLTVYVDGVARTPVDISTLGAITNGNDLTFSGGGDAPTVLHGAVLAETAWTAEQVARIRSQWTGE